MHKSLAVAAAILLLSGALAAQTSFYASNRAGMAFEEVASFRVKDLDWSLEVRAGLATETRILRRASGEEVKRWNIQRYPSGAVKVFETYSGGLLESVESYRDDGWMSSYEEYRDGELKTRSVWNVVGGALASIRTEAGDGSLLYTDSYLYAPSGALREVRRTDASGAVQSAGATFTGSRPLQTWYDSGALVDIQKYGPDGAAGGRERWKGADLVFSQARTDSPGGSKSIVKDSERGVTVERDIGPGGRVSQERSLKDGILLSRTDYAYDAQGRILRKTISSKGTRERVVYAWSGTDVPDSEQWYLNDKLVKRVTYIPPDSREEEIIKDGQVIMRVRYDSGRKAWEEAMKDGKVIRRRDIR